MIARRPGGEVPIPAFVVTIAAGREFRVVWENERGGLTFEIGSGAGRVFVKWAPVGSGLDLDAEAARLAWAAPFIRVPRLIDRDRDDTGSWIVTSGLPGESAVSEQWRSDPATAVAAIGDGLRALHDKLPVSDCPFSWAAEERVADARRRADTGEIDSERWHPEHRPLGIAEAVELADDVPPVTRVVVCHGDACAPNTLLGPDGKWTGHVDLGALGVADRWADFAVATWSCEWNYGPGWQDQLLAAYGIDPDPVSIRYYRLLWDLGP